MSPESPSDEENGDDSKGSDGGEALPSERLQTLPSDLLKQTGVQNTPLSLLGSDDAAKLADVLHAVGAISPRPMFEI